MSTKLATILADFTTSLATALAVGATSCSLQSATDDDGIALPSGVYFFTLDGQNSNKEHLVCTLSGTSLSAISSVSRQGVQTSGVVRAHRIGCTVSLTDFAHIKYIADLISGNTNLDASKPLQYDGTASITLANQLATKAYVDAVTVAGAPNGSTTVKGIFQEATQAQVLAKTQAGSTGADLIVNPSTLPSTLLSDYKADTGSANAYAITPAPAITAYVAGQVFSFKATNANTTASALNVNAIGSKTIKNSTGADLVANDILAGQIVVVEYDGTNFQMISLSGNGALSPTGSGSGLTGISVTNFVKSYTACESITAGAPVSIGIYQSDGGVLYDNSASSAFVASGTSKSISFTVGNNLNRMLVLYVVGTSTLPTTGSQVTYNGVNTTLVSSISRLSSFILPAPTVGTNSVVINGLTNAQNYSYAIFSYYQVNQSALPDNKTTTTSAATGNLSLALTPVADGSLILGCAMVAGTGLTISFTGLPNHSSQTTITGHQMIAGDAGTGFTSVGTALTAIFNTNDLSGVNKSFNLISLQPVSTPAYGVVNASSAVDNNRCRSFIGFAAATQATPGSAILVTTGGTNSNQSGLKMMQQYYLNDSNGTIGITAGTISRKVGIGGAVATEIQITNIW